MAYNHRKRIAKMAGRHGVDVKSVGNWHDLADRISRHFGKPAPDGMGPRAYCYHMAETWGWIERKTARTKSPTKASDCRRIDPVTGEVIEIIKARR